MIVDKSSAGIGVSSRGMAAREGVGEEQIMAITVLRQDLRYNTLKKGHNLRWPETEAQDAGRIELVESAKDAADALQRIVSAGLRPTVRSGGHCYEDFVVNNPGGAILDMSLLTGANRANDSAPYRIGPGTQLWGAYQELYRRYGVTIPAGTCASVCAGGHICGGGYGLLSRLYGLSTDWVTEIDILTVDAKGKVVPRTVNKTQDPDLFRACKGTGGGNFGVITSYVFETLPKAPLEVIEANMQFRWADMTEERFAQILMTYGEYFETRGQAPETWGLYGVLVPRHASGERFGMSVQFCNPDGTCNDLTVLREFLERFGDCGAEIGPHVPSAIAEQAHPGKVKEVCMGTLTANRRDWLDATQRNSGSGSASRAKYKSAHMKRNFTRDECKTMYSHMTRKIGDANLRSSVVEIDSHGGAINRAGAAQETAICQRSSVLKLQYQTYWADPKDDAAHLSWIRDFYTEMYSGSNVPERYRGTPFHGDRYEGCYINYPDADMLQHTFWPQLYYGDGELYPFLQGVKRKYDPNNIFHHAMSVRA